MAQSQSAANWRNTLTHVDHMHSLTHLHQQLRPCCGEAPAQLLQNWESNFILKVPDGGGVNRSIRRKFSTAYLLIGFTYKRRKFDVPDGSRRLEPSPSNIGDRLTRPRVRAASDTLSYRSPHLTKCQKVGTKRKPKVLKNTVNKIGALNAL